MKVDQIPAYCGGRFLWGFWTNNVVPPEGWYEHVDKNWYTKDRTGLNPDGSTDRFCAFMPVDLLLSQQILKNIMRNKVGKDQCAILMAVTSDNAQPFGRKFLEATGFTKAFTGRKNDYANQCTTWHGDMHKNVWPILNKIPDYVPEKAGKFA